MSKAVFNGLAIKIFSYTNGICSMHFMSRQRDIRDKNKSVQKSQCIKIGRQI